jgi:flagella synthesis protein FlgN
VADRKALIQQLSQQLAQEESFLRQFHDVLMEEHETLSQRDREALEEVVQRKQSILDEFQQAVKQRLETLKQLGAGEDMDMDQIQGVIEDCAKDAPEMTECWDNLQQLLATCKEQNAVNGAIIEVSAHHLQVALSILHGDTDSTELYDAKGRTRHGDGSSSSLAKA